MDLQGINLGLCMCGSFCTFNEVIGEVEALSKRGINVYPIFSYNADSISTRFGAVEDFRDKLYDITGNNIISTIKEAEPIGPQKLLDIMLVAPCTGNTMAKLNNGITDTPVTMACKAHLRNNRPLVIALATNDALGISLQNIGGLMIRKNIYFVPFGQDNPEKKPLSMIADFSKIYDSLSLAMEGKQIQPIIF
ncbi:MAG: dipicolinate synthase subunit B [Clostridia bacterium]|nr:dipicolinate synthase subunit B [Clostridia bacterium]